MRRPTHARVFSHVSDGGGDGRESLTSEGRTSSLAESLTFTRSVTLASVVFVACVLGLSLVNFGLGREFCRATVGYGCLRG